ncbi:c-Myc-binding protein homolog isoform X1 [Copidosoma floridanum]|uniref:c-Myc-binding protein homolog isoform X1 n=1 Tax=Copidosoma floridanum TaxID=29053 RepID=UPI0006C95C2F|nr:c-Myc-binding protein homolog isoform X1 [Copidosoma floridanum]
MSANTATTSPKPTDIKREDFRKYLEHAGVLDSLTNILIALYEEQDKPDDGTEYFRKYFASEAVEAHKKAEVDGLKRELAEAKAVIAELKEKIKQLEKSSPESTQ